MGGGVAMLRIREGIGAMAEGRDRPTGAARDNVTAWAAVRGVKVPRRRLTRSGYYRYAFGPQRRSRTMAPI